MADRIWWNSDKGSRVEVRSLSLLTSFNGFQIEDYRLRFKQLASDGHRFEWLQERRGYGIDHPELVTLPDWSRGESELYDDIMGGYGFWPLLMEHSVPRFNVFSEKREDASYANSWRGVVVPYWLVAVVTAWLPALHFLLLWWKVRRRIRPGLCAACGYDLRATPYRCPECGMIPEKVKV